MPWCITHGKFDESGPPSFKWCAAMCQIGINDPGRMSTCGNVCLESKVSPGWCFATRDSGLTRVRSPLLWDSMLPLLWLGFA
jgi:hypothetical protein